MFYNDSFDIASFKGDAIINSLGAGRNITIPGQLYRAILKASSNPQGMMQYISNLAGEKDIGEVFLTDSFGLPCKKIIHVITPFRRYDKDYVRITECYRKILQIALENKLESITIPLIGTGANGYDSDRVGSIARKLCYKFSLEHPEIDIYFNVYSIEHEEEGGLQSPQVLEAAGFYREEKIEKPSKISLHELIEGKTPFLESIGIKFEDSFATFVRKFVFSRTKGNKKEKEEALEDIWLEINAMIGDYKNSKDIEESVNTLHELKEKGIPFDHGSFKGKPTHAPQYEWKKIKNSKTHNYVYQRPNKAELLLTCTVLHLKPIEALEVFYFCGYALSPYERYEYAFRKCVEHIADKQPWTEVIKQYIFFTGESLYDYKEDRKKIYTDDGESW